MIDYIRGKVTYLAEEGLVIETGGIGYHIHTGNPYRFDLSGDEEITVFTYQYVREDTLALYGFVTREERRLFEKLLQVSGIGPKVAMVILASGSPAQVIEAIQTENSIFLTQFPGIGKKTAQRIIVELKDKLDDIRFSEWAHQETAAVQESEMAGTERAVNERSALMEEALQALKGLGYSDHEVRRILPQIEAQAENEWEIEEYIKTGLRLLTK